MTVTSLHQKLDALLSFDGCTSGDILRCIQDHVRENPEGVWDVFPSDTFTGSLRSRVMDGERLRHVQEAVSKARQARTDIKDRRADRVMAFVRTLPNHDDLSYREIADALNKSDIQPARGGNWRPEMVFRLIGERRQE